MTPATRSLSPGARGESPDAAPCHRLRHIVSARCRHCEARGAASPRRWSTVRGPPKVHQGRSLRSGLAQSLEDQHSSVDLVITVDHASRAPVCGVGLGRLAGVLGESVWPQPFARLEGSIYRDQPFFYNYNALGHVHDGSFVGCGTIETHRSHRRSNWIGFALFWNLLSGNILAVLRDSQGRPEFNNPRNNCSTTT